MFEQTLLHLTESVASPIVTMHHPRSRIGVNQQVNVIPPVLKNLQVAQPSLSLFLLTHTSVNDIPSTLSSASIIKTRELGTMLLGNMTVQYIIHPLDSPSLQKKPERQQGSSGFTIVIRNET